ncbi:hypothetical protein [Rhizobium binxianense]|uniref:hypothetical protein n=1 Tax=Rhizobium binxianense TaxID=3024242 RepID=UPI0023612996|nr:hypothetical protein [Rhizobium sp. MJ37]MDC9836585.1 hypothetical protein [Rhizobium sp. MJ37]
MKDDSFDLTGVMLTTDELAASRSGYPARPERKSGLCPLFCFRMAQPAIAFLRNYGANATNR